jgi:anti-sigma factor RsiW
MAHVTHGEIAALADGALPRPRRTQVEAAIAESPELARLLAVQVRVASTIRAAAARAEVPDRLRDTLAELGDGGNPDGARRP